MTTWVELESFNGKPYYQNRSTSAAVSWSKPKNSQVLQAETESIALGEEEYTDKRIEIFRRIQEIHTEIDATGIKFDEEQPDEGVLIRTLKSVSEPASNMIMKSISTGSEYLDNVYQGVKSIALNEESLDYYVDLAAERSENIAAELLCQYNSLSVNQELLPAAAASPTLEGRKRITVEPTLAAEGSKLKAVESAVPSKQQQQQATDRDSVISSTLQKQTSEDGAVAVSEQAQAPAADAEQRDESLPQV